MKLRNLLFGTMIACAFASCSNDDDPILTPDPTPTANADLAISFETLNAKGTKAGDEIQTSDEKKINKLGIFVYDNADHTAPIAQAWLDEGETTATFKGLPAGKSIICYAYANISDEAYATIKEYGKGIAVAIPESGFNKANLPMAGTSEVVPLNAGSNEATVNLVRTVSRVDVVKVDLDINQSSKLDSDFKDIREAKFQLAGFTLNGVSSSSLSASANNDCAAFWGGLAVGQYRNTVTTEIYKTATVKDMAMQNEDVDKDGKLDAVNIFAENLETPLVSYYVLPNKTDANVTLVMEGSFGYTAGNTSVNPSESTYPIVIAKDNQGGDLVSNGKIECNKVYRISITVAGYGKDKDGNGKPELVVNAVASDYVPLIQKVVVE